MDRIERLNSRINALAKDVEQILRGEKLFTKEQLAEAYLGVSFDLPEYIVHAFGGTIGEMVDTDVGKIPAAVIFKRHPKIAPEFVPSSHKSIIESFRTMQHAAWENSKAHGWNEAVDNPASALMMITREVSELAEEERDASSGESAKIPGFSKKEEEAADVAIRLLSYCGARNMRLGEAICAKHEFNKTRPYRHGNKLF